LAHINTEVKAFQAAGEPAISVDTKKKELVGDFKNAGRELRPKVHDFVIPELGKAVPYGIYDIADNPDGSISASATTPRYSPSRASAAGGTNSAPPAIPPRRDRPNG
jgi:Rhodopirellula transposase DDE domain